MTVTYHSDAIMEIAKALSNFQSKLPTIPKNKTVSFFSKKLNKEVTYSYTPYDTIVEVVKEPLKENGLMFTHLVCGDDLITMLIHSSGEWFKTVMKLTCSPADQQGYCSDITYKRRYSLSAILGIATDEDDDGEKAQESESNYHKETQPQHEPVKKPTLTPESKRWNRAIDSYRENGNLDKVKEQAYISPEHEQLIIETVKAEKKSNIDEDVPF